MISQTSSRMKNIIGPFAYLITGVRLLRRKETLKLDIDIDNGRELITDYNGWTIDVGNIMHAVVGSVASP